MPVTLMIVQPLTFCLQGLLACIRYVPLGLAKWFKGVGVHNVHEMRWWQEAQVPHSSVTLACVPAQVLPLHHIAKHELPKQHAFGTPSLSQSQTLCVIHIPKHGANSVQHRHVIAGELYVVHCARKTSKHGELASRPYFLLTYLVCHLPCQLGVPSCQTSELLALFYFETVLCTLVPN